MEQKEFEDLRQKVLTGIQDLSELIPTSVEVCKEAAEQCRIAMEGLARFANRIDLQNKVVDIGNGSAIIQWLFGCQNRVKEIIAEKRNMMNSVNSVKSDVKGVVTPSIQPPQPPQPQPHSHIQPQPQPQQQAQPTNPMNCSNVGCDTLYNRFVALTKSSQSLYKEYSELKSTTQKDSTSSSELKAEISRLKDLLSNQRHSSDAQHREMEQKRLESESKVTSLENSLRNKEEMIHALKDSIKRLEAQHLEQTVALTRTRDELTQVQTQTLTQTRPNYEGMKSDLSERDYYNEAQTHPKRPCYGVAAANAAGIGAWENEDNNNNNNNNNTTTDLPKANGFVSATFKLLQERKEKGLNGTGLNQSSAPPQSTSASTAVPPRRVVKFVTPYEAKKNSLAQNAQGNVAKGAIQSSNAPSAVKKAFGEGSPANTADDAPKTGPGGIPLDENGKMPGRLAACEPALVEIILNEMLDGSPGVRWDDIAGLEFAKKNVIEIVVWPMLRPDLFRGLRGPPKGMMLFGPPGTGKTLIGKAIATESKAKFFSISASSLTSKWHGQGEKLVRALFAVAEYYEPSVIFIDEIDSLLSQRQDAEFEASRRIKTEFLVQLDGVGTMVSTDGSPPKEPRILVVGATNRPHELDEAARRRLVKRLYVPLPDSKARLQLISHLINKERHNLTSDCFQDVVMKTRGYSGADLKALCAEAAMGPLRDLTADILNVESTDVRPISFQDFLGALSQVRASVDSKDLAALEKWNDLFGSFPVEKPS